uniref:Caspase activity and apoptosis inhibitor 1-like n=1 Tax=Crassostrea virginica TaxID=6565 RepID=A0A8B8CZG4_CRAVI|nr:caspase activity and apoptosis inhibitor 1-like [Crassostrea virginica]XP_022319889.1 caspase activity and apoptosis inhibitor 1-like [Crassostrea virginica]XP_022319890.1 caspase activity and apoptosis inhibitor 1-like [Crassostrea virginica]XP_022319891.1 caspase activity and apoptosis inhibitor 1-like [Crassostrea virginica]XP_022319892.1 caspase activity and apoptosis inhibitor 1-like [Crassostrea virginica]
MSAKKMVADSTQADPDPLLVTSKRKKNSQKKKKHQSTKKKKSAKVEDEDSDLDLEKGLSSIGAYLNNRQEMVEQMFHSLRGATLKRHIPDILKEMTIEELKEKCVEQLEVMSKKRIKRILAGDDPASISSSGTEDENSDEEYNNSGQQLKEASPEVEDTAVDSTSCPSDGTQDLAEGEMGDIETQTERQTRRMERHRVMVRLTLETVLQTRRGRRERGSCL